MTIGLDFGLAVLAFFVVIGPLIFFHEMGHFIAARLNGITVEEFGIGYPPRMLTLFERNGTKYTLNWLPMGGFMRPAGEDDPSVPGGLAAASKRARLTVLAAGPAANFLVALLLLIVMFMIGAPEEQPGALVTAVEPASPAEAGGLLPGDVILAVDGQSIDTYSDLTRYIFAHVGQTMTMHIQRGGAALDLTLTARNEWPEDQGPTGIQVQPIYEVRSYGLLQSIGRSLQEIGVFLRTFVELPARVIEGQIAARYLRPVSVIGISQLGGQAMEAAIDQNVVWPIIQLTAMISLALAITNLLPIPALDGGRILFVLVEAVRGRRVSPERETLIHFVGFALLIMAMFLFMYLDIVDPLVK